MLNKNSLSFLVNILFSFLFFIMILVPCSGSAIKEKYSTPNYSPDGKKIASGCFDKIIRIWDIATGREEKLLKGHTGYINSVNFSPDGKKIVSGSNDKTIRIWDVATGREDMVLKDHTGVVNSVNFSPDGEKIASGSDDKTIRIWDAATGKVINTLIGHTGIVTSVNFSPDGKKIVSGSDDRTICIWDAAAGKLINTLKGYYIDVVNSVNFSPDGEKIVSGSDDKTIRICDAATGKLINTLRGHTDVVNSVNYSPDGKKIVSGSNDKTIRIWDTEMGGEDRILETHTNFVNSVNYSPDGKKIVSGSNDKTIRIWDIEMGREDKILEIHTNFVNSVNYSPDGKKIVSGSDDNTVRIWDIEMGGEDKILEIHTNFVNSVNYSPDGKKIVSGSSDKTVHIWDIATGRKEKLLKGHTGYINSVNFNLDGKKIVSGSDDKTVRIWETATGMEEKILEGHTDRVKSVNFSPDEKKIVSGSDDKTIRIWDVATGKLINTLVGHTDVVNSVNYNPDGKKIVSGSSDKTVRIWVTATGREEKVLYGHTDIVNSVNYSPDGKKIVSGSSDKTVRIWDIATGREEKLLKGHTGYINSVNFSPDGKKIVSGSDDNTIYIWDVGTGEHIATFIGFDDREWLVFIPENYFNCSKNGDRYLVYINNKASDDFNTFYTRYYSPEIVNALLTGNAELRKKLIAEKLQEYYKIEYIPYYTPSPVPTKSISTDSTHSPINTPPPDSTPEPSPSLSHQDEYPPVLSIRYIKADGQFYDPDDIRDIQLTANDKNIIIAAEITAITGEIAEIYFRFNGIKEEVKIKKGQRKSNIKHTLKLDKGKNNIILIAVTTNNTQNQYEFTCYLEDVFTGTYYGLFFAVNEYDKMNDLTSPIPRAQQLQKILTNAYTFKEENIKLIENPKRADFFTEINAFTNKIKKNDSLLIFYSGHGYWDKVTNEGFWLPRESTKDNISSWISNFSIQNLIKKISCKHILLISDACYSGSILYMDPDNKKKEIAHKELAQLKSRTALTSGALTKVPNNGPFLKYIIKYLESQNGRTISTSCLFEDTKNDIIAELPEVDGIKITPMYGIIRGTGDEGGDFIFVRKE